jgi:hypothetical protein
MIKFIRDESRQESVLWTEYSPEYDGIFGSTMQGERHRAMHLCELGKEAVDGFAPILGDNLADTFVP